VLPEVTTVTTGGAFLSLTASPTTALAGAATPPLAAGFDSNAAVLGKKFGFSTAGLRFKTAGATGRHERQRLTGGTQNRSRMEEAVAGMTGRSSIVTPLRM
jgi:hypothetical protein